MASNYGASADNTRRPSNFDVETPKSGPELNMSTSCTKILTIVGAIFIIIHNGLRITEHVMARSHEKHGGGFNMTRYEELNPTDIANRWEVRRSNRAMHVFDEFAGIIGWACVVPVIVIGARILTRGNPTSYVQFAVPMFSFAVLIRLLEWTFNMGQRTGSDWMSSWGSMAVNSGEKGVQLIQVLEVAYELARMRDTWFFAMDWLFIAGGIFCLSLAAKQENLLTRGHYIMGFIIAGLGVLQWIFDLLMLVKWMPFMIFGGITRALVGIILFPIWLVWFGCILGRYRGTELNTLLN